MSDLLVVVPLLTADAQILKHRVDIAEVHSKADNTSDAFDPLSHENHETHGNIGHSAQGSQIHLRPEGQRKKSSALVSSGVFRSWWLEILSIVLSIGSLASVAGVLLAYEDQPLSTWTFRYLPNSVVSQLMTVARSTLMLSTASCISQSCWLYMKRKPRRLLDIEILDAASRGPAGAAFLLTSGSAASLIAIVGSFITISTLLMESFTQQVLQFPLRNDVGLTNGTFPVSSFYAPAPFALYGK